jgi:hypothetical protein
MIPTVGFNMRKVTKGNVSIKVRPPRCALWPPAVLTQAPREALGLGRADALPQHVGALLQGRERYCVRALRGGSELAALPLPLRRVRLGQG